MPELLVVHEACVLGLMGGNLKLRSVVKGFV